MSTFFESFENCSSKEATTSRNQNLHFLGRCPSRFNVVVAGGAVTQSGDRAAEARDPATKSTVTQWHPSLS